MRKDDIWGKTLNVKDASKIKSNVFHLGRFSVQSIIFKLTAVMYNDNYCYSIWKNLSTRYNVIFGLILLV